MVLRNRLVTAIVLMSLSMYAAMAQTDRRVALVIGNASYVNFGKLKNPENDSRAVAAMLRQFGFDVIEQENDSRRAMIQATRNFAGKLSPGGIGLFYYAGHGIQAQGANYLVPVDAALAVEDDLKYETLDVQDVLNKLDESRVRLSIVILDACRDNPFKSFRSQTNGLALLNPPAGTVIVYATAPGKVAADGTGDNSVFTTELLKAMSKPDRLLDVFANVTEAVQRRTGNQQTPWINSSFRGDFYFTGPTTATVAPPPEPAMVGLSPEIVFWQSIAGSTNPADFTAYLDQFPRGNFVALARIRLASLATGPMAAPPPQIQNPRLSDSRNPQAGSAPGVKQKPVAGNPTDTQIPSPSSADMPKPAISGQEPSRLQPVQPAAKPPPAVAEVTGRPKDAPSAVRATAEPLRVQSAKPPLVVADIVQPKRTVAPAPGIHAPPQVQEAAVRPGPTGALSSPPPEAVQPPPAVPTPRPYCNIPRFYGMDTGAGAYAAISVANTGDRCGVRVTFGPRAQPYESLTLSAPPSHGAVTIEGNAFYYTPSPGFTGNDEFNIVSTPWGHVRAVVKVSPPEIQNGN